jgi:hypothetical protein
MRRPVSESSPTATSCILGFAASLGVPGSAGTHRPGTPNAPRRAVGLHAGVQDTRRLFAARLRMRLVSNGFEDGLHCFLLDTRTSLHWCRPVTAGSTHAAGSRAQRGHPERWLVWSAPPAAADVPTTTLRVHPCRDPERQG